MPWTAAHPLTRLDLGASIDSLFLLLSTHHSQRYFSLLLRWRLLNLVSCVILYCTMKVTQRNTVANVLVSPLVLASLLILSSPFSVARLCQQIAALFGVYCAPRCFLLLVQIWLAFSHYCQGTSFIWYTSSLSLCKANNFLGHVASCKVGCELVDGFGCLHTFVTPLLSCMMWW
jgi:hypothetical protein